MSDAQQAADAVAACPWHAFWQRAAERGLSVDALRDYTGSVSEAAAARPLAAALTAAAAAPLAAALVSARARRLVWDTADTVTASALLVALVCTVLGLPLSALYMMVVGAGYLGRFIMASLGWA